MQEEKIYRLIFEHSVQGMILRQGDRIVLVNQSFATMVGYSIDELLGFSFDDALNLVHPEDRGWVLRRFRDRMAQKDVPTSDEYRFVRRNGDIGWWSVAVATIDDEGQGAILETYIDITERKRTEESIQSERKFLIDVLNALPIGVCLNDETGHYRIVNEAYCRIYDFDRATMIGKHYTTIMPPDQVDLANRHFAQILKGDLGIPVERKRQRKDGSSIYIEAANALVQQADGGKMVITVVRDINDRKLMENALRASEERFRTLVDEAPIAILLVAMNEEIKLANKKAVSLFGYEADALQDMPLSQLLPSTYRDSHHRLVQGFFQDTPADRLPLPLRESMTYGLRADGTEFSADITLGQIRLQDDLMAVAFVADATERRELEQQRLALQLEQERSAILASFLQNAAHEFRTPLSVIKIGIFLLNNVQSAEERSQHSEQIMEQVDALARLVNQLILVARLRHSEETRIESIELNHLIERVIFAHQAELNAKQLRVQTESGHEPIYLVGDPNDLESAFSEIIDNAIKYSVDGGQISLRVSIAEDNQAVVAIQDSGAGMTEETRCRAFERFYREDTAHSTRGFGLGLSIARQILELHDGTIRLESALHLGTTVYISLPYVSLQTDEPSA